MRTSWQRLQIHCRSKGWFKAGSFAVEFVNRADRMKQTERSDTARGLGASEEQETHLLLRLCPCRAEEQLPSSRPHMPAVGLIPKAIPKGYTQRQSHLPKSEPRRGHNLRHTTPRRFECPANPMCPHHLYDTRSYDILIAGAVPPRHDPASAFRYAYGGGGRCCCVVLLLEVVDAVLAFPFVVGIVRAVRSPYTTLANARGARLAYHRA